MHIESYRYLNFILFYGVLLKVNNRDRIRRPLSKFPILNLIQPQHITSTLEGEGKKLKGLLIERSRGLISWVRFGETGGFICCRDSTDPSTQRKMEVYRLDYRENSAGSVLSMGVRDVEGKRFKVFIHEGKDLVGQC